MTTISRDPIVALRKENDVQPLWKRFAIYAFPVATNVWPLLLFLSQKAFVAPGIILNGFGDREYRRDLVLATAISFVGVLVYFHQVANSYAFDHLIGFLVFTFSIPLINRSVRFDNIELRKILTYFTLFNATIGIAASVLKIDLSGFRGLNSVVAADGFIDRVYFESTSIAAVFMLESFRSKFTRALSLGIVLLYLIFVAKSIVVVLLIGVNLSFPYILKSSPLTKVLIAIILIGGFFALYVYLPILRPDVALSLAVKQQQLNVILGSLSHDNTGWGWGSFFSEFATDPSQPYQIEMQLPMLVLQIGIVAVTVIGALMLVTFFTTASRSLLAIGRFLAYILIGFNNPWLFVPSWFLTCQLLFRYNDDA